MMDLGEIKNMVPKLDGLPSELGDVLDKSGIGGQNDFLELISKKPSNAASKAYSLFKDLEQGDVRRRWGEAAIALSSHAAEKYEEEGGLLEAGHMHSFAADVLNNLGRKDEALTHYRKSARYTQEEEPGHAGHQHSYIADILREKGDDYGAINHYLDSANLTRDMNPEHAAIQQENAADVFREIGEKGKAMNHYRKAGGLSEEAAGKEKEKREAILGNAFREYRKAQVMAGKIPGETEGKESIHHNLIVQDLSIKIWDIKKEIGDQPVRKDAIQKLEDDVEGPPVEKNGNDKRQKPKH